MTLLVFVEKRNARIDYIFELMLGSIAGFDFVITEDENEFIRSQAPKLSYSRFAVGNETHISAAGLLMEVGINNQEILFADHKGVACPFAVQGSSDFPFDLFSAGFYLVTRYEEYLNSTRDQHGRFCAKDSLAYKKGFLDQPVINSWSLELRTILKNKFPLLNYRSSAYQIISTIDIDQAYAYKARGLYRTVGGLLKNIFSLNVKNVVATLEVLSGTKRDPFDTFDFIDYSLQQHNYPLLFFIHLGDHGTYDKSIVWSHPSMRCLAEKIKTLGKIGLHPSYASNSNGELLNEEVNRFEILFGYRPTVNRQHYLKLNIPETYRHIIEKGFTDDHTMGYADYIGFRASISTSFLFFDLEKETVTDLRIHPFAVMDRTLKDRMKLSAEEAKAHVKQMQEVIKQSEGRFIILWHNESLSDEGEWKGWRAVYNSSFE